MPRPPRIFLSRTTAGLAALAEKVAAVLKEREFEIIHQPVFGLEWRRLRHMLMEKVRDADVVLCLVGPVYGFAPRSTIPEFRDPGTGREEFSYTQLEYLLARRLHKPLVTILVPEALCAFARPEDRGTPEQRQRQADFIRDFIKKGEHAYHEFTSEAELIGAIRSRLIDIPPLLPPPRPENIPFRSIGTVFTGRADTLRSLRESLATADGSGNGTHRPAVHVINGPGGVGKTRLTVEYAHTHHADYTARLFVRGGSPGALDESLASLAGLFILNLEEQDEKETEVRIAAVLRWLVSHPGYLLVVDNVDTGDARDHAVEVLARLPVGHVLITSRLHTWPGDILRTPLSVLSDTDSRDLLLKYRSSPKAPAPATDADDALSLARDLDGLALAVEQAAAYLNVLAITIAEYHERWKTNAERVREWHDPAHLGYPASVATTWLTSFEQLAPASQAFLNLLSWLAPDPIPRFLLKPLAEKKLQPDPLTGTHPGKALGELIGFSLANPAQNGSAFAVHRLIQQVTRERQEPPHPAPALILALEWVNKEYPQDSDEARTWPIAIPLTPHAISTAIFAADHGIPEPSSLLLNQAALCLESRANYRTAEPLYRRALAIDQASLGDSHPKFALGLNNLAQLLLATNRLDEAEPMMRRALAIWESSLGADEPEVATGLNNLALLMQATNRFAEAEPLMRRALSIWEASLGADHPRVGDGLHNLALLMQTAGRFDEAEPRMRRALAIMEAHLGVEDPRVATCLHNLARLLKDTDRLAEAERLMRRALAIHEASLGDSHPDVARDLSNLAQLLTDTNRKAEAERLYQRALAIDEACFGGSHPSVARELINLAKLLRATGRLTEAEPLMRRALAISEASFGAVHPLVATILNNLAQVLEDTNRLTEAESLMRRALTIDEASFGGRHPDVARDLNNLASLLQATNRLAEAEPLMRRALAIDETNLGDSHPTVAISLNNLAHLLEATNQLAEVEGMYRRALAISETSLGAEHPQVATCLNNLARLLQDTNRPAEAEPLFWRALAIDEASFGGSHPDVAIRLNNIARLLQDTNRLAAAEPLMLRAVSIVLGLTRDTGHQHPNLITVLKNYKRLLLEMGDTQEQATEKIRAVMAPFGMSI